jgi:hypothetical protein
MYHNIANNPFAFDLEPMKIVLLSDATLDEVKLHYKQNANMRQKFDDIRPGFYFTQGTFKTDPLIEHYKMFMREEGIKYIGIKD